MSARVVPLTWIGLATSAVISLSLTATLLLIDPAERMAPPETVGSITAAGPSQQEENLRPAKPLSLYDEILKRPVLFKSRSPYVPPPPPPPPTPKPPPPAVVADPGFKLGGVMMSGTRRKAYLFSPSDPNGTWVDEHGVVTGWTVRSIEPGLAVLKNGDRTIELRLYER
jgi:hypothetical protein